MRDYLLVTCIAEPDFQTGFGRLSSEFDYPLAGFNESQWLSQATTLSGKPHFLLTPPHMQALWSGPDAAGLLSGHGAFSLCLNLPLSIHLTSIALW